MLALFLSLGRGFCKNGRKLAPNGGGGGGGGGSMSIYV